MEYSCNIIFHIVYFSLGIFDQRITSIKTETSSPTSILVSWILLYNQTANSNETFSVYYSTAGGAEVLAGITSSLKFNITKLLSNVEYRIRIEVNVMFLLKQTFSLQTFHLISIPKDPSPMTTEVTSTSSTLNPMITEVTSTSSTLTPMTTEVTSTSSTLTPMTTETISTSTKLHISSNFQFTPEISYTVGVVSIVYILLFALFVIFASIVFCCCKMTKKRGDKRKNENNLQAMQAHVNPVNPDNSLYASIENDKIHS